MPRTFTRKPSPRFGAPGLQATWARPVYSTGLGCNRSQIEEFRAAARRDGLERHIDWVTHDTKGGPRAGTAILPSRSSRRKAMKWRQLHDNDGGYGDG